MDSSLYIKLGVLNGLSLFLSTTTPWLLTLLPTVLQSLSHTLLNVPASMDLFSSKVYTQYLP